MLYHHTMNNSTRGRRGIRIAKSKRPKVAILSIALVFAVSTAVSFLAVNPSSVFARNYEAEIKALEGQVRESDRLAGILAGKKDTLANKIAELDNQQASIRALINLNEAKKAKIEQDISRNEALLKSRGEELSKNLQDQYYSKQTSTLDILMNSKSISDYVDKQSRQAAIGDLIQKSVKEIQGIKVKLNKDKKKVEDIIFAQKARNTELAKARSEKQKILDETQGQEDRYREISKANNSRIAQLRRAQAAEIARRLASQRGGATRFISRGQTCGGGYPAIWCNAPQDSRVDNWGMYSRECVSYTAFKVASTFGWPNRWTRGGNNAKQWLGKARRLGIKTSSVPAPNTVAVMTSGYYGHVAWVEEVHGNRIVVSDYNRNMDGRYSRYETSASAFNGYIYFGR